MPARYDDKADKELLQLFHADGNNEWLGILLERYTSLLLGVSMKYLKNEEDAKDSVQQVFVKVINELHKYPVEYFKSWLYMIAKNHCLMKLRDKKNISQEFSENMYLPAEVDERSAPLEKEAALTQLEQALTLLNHEQRVCVTLFYLEKKTYHEIAEQTSYSLMQVKSNIQNGKRNLKIHMQRMNHEQ